jgi:pectinesterase
MYLGRPWRPYAMTLYMNTQLPAVIRSEGWDNWGNAANEQTARYMEYNNTGAGANTAKRAGWSKILSAAEVAEYSLEKVMREWKPEQFKSE